MPPTDPLAGLDDVDWSGLHTSSGPADELPGLLTAARSQDPSQRAAALEQLWLTVWNQGTVSDVTPAAIPFLLALVADADTFEGIRAEVAILLASAAAPTSFVLGDPPRWFVVGWARDGEDPVPAVELDEACRAALVSRLDLLDAVFASAPPRVRACAVAVAAVVAGELSPAAREAIAGLAAAEEPLLAAAATLTLDLAAGQTFSDAELGRRVEVDAEVAEFLAHIPTWPTEVRAVEVVRELCERAVPFGLTDATLGSF